MNPTVDPRHPIDGSSGSHRAQGSWVYEVPLSSSSARPPPPTTVPASRSGPRLLP